MWSVLSLLLVSSAISTRTNERRPFGSNIFLNAAREIHPEITFRSGRPPQYDFDDGSTAFNDVGGAGALRTYPPDVGYDSSYLAQFEKLFRPKAQQQCLARPACDDKSIYRTIDGSCNNLKNPLWGAANTPYARAVPDRYSDGIHGYPRSVSGKPLPRPRELSRQLLPIAPIEDEKLTLLFMQWGQIITHDMSLAKDSLTTETTCCGPRGILKRKSKGEKCEPPTISQDDPIYKKHKQTCFDFRRTSTDSYDGCPSGKAAKPLSQVTHWMDASLVYGNSDAASRELRLGQRGLMKVDVKKQQEWPPNIGNVNDSCNFNNQSVCYRMGDVRSNQNPGLSMLQIILLREHNRLARGLFSVNPHWDNERIFQEARRILIAQVQHISYQHWLPLLFPDCKRRRESDATDYDSRVDPSVLNEHAQGAFRSLHSNIHGHLQVMNERRYSLGYLKLPEHMNDVSVLEADDMFDELVRGHSTQLEQAYDRYHDQAVKEDIFRNPLSSMVGFDLKTLDIQRDRDHGLGSYNDLRAWCGLPRAHSFSDFSDAMSSEDASTLSTVYEHVDDVDLSVGGMLEGRGTHGSSGIGPVFACIMKEQFRRTREADRFFYDFQNHPAAFTQRQLDEIKKSSIARFICDHSRNVTLMQPNAFLKIDKSNLLMECSDYNAIPIVDLEAWRQRYQPIRNSRTPYSLRSSKPPRPPGHPHHHYRHYY